MSTDVLDSFELIYNTKACITYQTETGGENWELLPVMTLGAANICPSSVFGFQHPDTGGKLSPLAPVLFDCSGAQWQGLLPVVSL